ncbi:hypothetical protein CQA65_30565, partial [Klebsiella pneumoniae]
KDLPQAEQTLRSLLNDDPQNAAARENLYYVLREAKLFRADVLRHNKDLPQAEQTLRSLLNDDPQNAAARENLYYVLRE